MRDPQLQTPQKTVNLTAYYDAAATTPENDYGNFSLITSEDFYYNTATRAIAQGRLRREVRNNPYLAGMVNKWPDAIGYSNLRSRTSSKDYNAKKDLWWYRLSKSITNTGDSLRTVETIVKRELLIAGEIFFVLLTNGKVQMIPSEYCGSPFTGGIAGEKNEINGIQYDDAGRPIAYRFGKMAVGGMIDFQSSAVIPARYVIHVFHKDHVQMGRGLPWLLPSLKTARDLYEITRAKTAQIKTASLLAGFIEKTGAVDALRGMAPSPQNADGSPKAESSDDPVTPISAGPTKLELKNGTFIALEPGEKVNTLMSQYHAGDYKELIIFMLHAMSAPIGLAVELWYSGLGDVSYSGFKGLGTQWDGRRKDIIGFLEEVFLNKYQFWAASKAANEGDLPANPDKDDDLVDWAWRRTPVLDDEKNAKANQWRLQTGELSLAEVWEGNGLYPEEVFEHRRQLWIKMQIAAGNLEEGADMSTVHVPEIFLLRGLLPGEKSFSTLAPSNSPADDAAPSSDKNAPPPPAAPPEEATTTQKK